MNFKKILPPWALFILLLTTDILVKKFVIETFTEDTLINHGFFGFIKAFNYGISFGMLDSFSMYLLTMINILAVMFIIYKFVKEKFNPYIFVVIMAGSIGNLLDRLIYGYVVDYFYIFGFKTIIILNLADVMITLGVGLFLYNEFLKMKNEAKKLYESYGA